MMPSTQTDRLNGLTTSIAVKAPVRIVTNANITLSGEQTVNGVAVVDGDRVLVKDQTAGADNGIYVVSTSAWQRSADFDGNNDVVQGTLVVSTHDTTIFYRVTTANPITIGTTELAFTAVTSALTQAIIGQVLYPQTAAEASAGVTPTSYHYPELDARRYGVSAASSASTNATGINNASLVAFTAGGGIVELPPGTLSYDSSILFRDGVKFRGYGESATVLSYTGAAEGIKSVSPGTRIYACGLEYVYLTDAGTGTYGLDLDSISTSAFENVTINGFTTAVRNYSPTAGFSVYNRFYNVTANACTNGFQCTGTSSNAHVFDACRFNGSTVVGTVGWLFADSNGNTVINSHTDVAGIHIQLTASAPGITDGNVCWANRIEGVTTGHDVGVNVRHTHIGANYYSSVTNRITDAGTDTIIYDPFWNTPGIKARFQTASAAGGHISYTREASGGSELPFMLLTDQNTGSGTPVTHQVATERLTGFFYRGVRGGSTYFDVSATGKIRGADKILPGSDAGALQSAAGIYAGSGVPNNANGSNGDFYLRGDGTAAGNNVIYHKEGGSWVALTTT